MAVTATSHKSTGEVSGLRHRTPSQSGEQASAPQNSARVAVHGAHPRAAMSNGDRRTR